VIVATNFNLFPLLMNCWNYILA